MQKRCDARAGCCFCSLGYVQWINFRPAEKFERTFRSHGTVQFRSHETLNGLTSKFRSVKLVPCGHGTPKRTNFQMVENLFSAVRT